MSEAAEPQARFERLVGAVSGLDDVTLGSGRRGFGSEALHVNGRIFAMLTGRRLVVKLPADRVASLIASGEGVAFDAGKGRPMKEWVALATDDDDAWQARAQEARDFVSRPQRRSSRKPAQGS